MSPFLLLINMNKSKIYFSNLELKTEAYFEKYNYMEQTIILRELEALEAVKCTSFYIQQYFSHIPSVLHYPNRKFYVFHEMQ